MKSLVARVPQICLILIAVIAPPPADAGEVRSKASIHHGRFVKPHGVAIFHRSSRDLPNGVSIFRRRSSALHVPVAKPNRPKHVGNALGIKHRHLKPHGKFKKPRHAMNDRDRRGMKKASKRKHKGHKKHKHHKKHRRHKKYGHHKKHHVVYGSAVHYVLPEDEYIYPEHADGEDCRHLTERGYDLSGRRVLVEWKLCFDENGEAYVPEDGRRILARY